MDLSRKPLAFAQSRRVKSIRYADPEWNPFEEAALLRDTDAGTLARECSIIGLNVICTPALLEAYARIMSGIQRAAIVGRASHGGTNGR